MATQRTITLYAFASAKGGVGKSTLAVACATTLARQGRRVAVLDADMTGSSLADGLDLVAPVLDVGAGGGLDLLAPATGRWYGRQETWRLIDAREDTEAGDPAEPPIVFLNDALRVQTEEGPVACRMDALAWRREGGDERIAWYPSSPLERDQKLDLAWLYEETYWEWTARLAWLLRALADQVPDLTAAVVDLPPGLFGFTHGVMTFLNDVARRGPLPPAFPAFETERTTWRVRPYLVTSEDHNDLYVAVRSYVKLRPQFPDLLAVVNRARGGAAELRAAVRRRFAARHGDLGVERDFRLLDEMPDLLGRVFVDGPSALEARAIARVSEALDLEGQ